MTKAQPITFALFAQEIVIEKENTLTLYLNTQFTEEETKTLRDYIDACNTDVSNIDLAIVYAVDTNRISGVTDPRRMIAVGGLYLCEEKDDRGVWYMGDQNNGNYSFWGSYGNLQEALNGL